jgi:hypothetical protein
MADLVQGPTQPQEDQDQEEYKKYHRHRADDLQYLQGHLDSFPLLDGYYILEHRTKGQQLFSHQSSSPSSVT